MGTMVVYVVDVVYGLTIKQGTSTVVGTNNKWGECLVYVYPEIPTVNIKRYGNAMVPHPKKSCQRGHELDLKRTKIF